jgi:hypothetical protein
MICPRVPGGNVICVLFRQDWGNASGVRISCQEQVIEIKQAMRPGDLTALPLVSFESFLSRRRRRALSSST